ncbi:hypothetical protein X801_06728 [Opisthorchis viverrini]|uniref:GPI ethanolamine phosphate transferase 1 n=1 Tax=Opisthorchis viverrini TaxID=6198 RepID=A0A1S8WSY1_OPIVI|nr:hypothetical protein X801_06728 [Opisthorchis viverrini]
MSVVFRLSSPRRVPSSSRHRIIFSTVPRGVLAALASCAVLLVRSSIELPSVISLSVQLFSWSVLAEHNEQPDDTKDALNFRNFRQSLFFVSFSRFGINLANHYFDPRSTYCFITLLKPAVMAVFLMLKILIPMLCLGVIYAAVQLASVHSLSNHSTGFREKGTQIAQTALCVIMSNFIAIHFFVWLRDEGSWLDIGTSISHYVIAMGIGFVSFLFSSLGRKILCLSISEPCVDDRNGVRKYM